MNSEIDSLKNYLRLVRRYYSSLGLMYFLGTLVIFAIQNMLFFCEQLFFTGSYRMDVYLILSTLPMYLVGMPILALLVKRIPAVQIEKHKMTPGQWLAAFVMSYAIVYLSNFIGLFFTQIIGRLKGSSVDNLLQDIITEISPWTAFFLVALCAPVVEELIFRKLLIERAVKYGKWTAILFSALFFALFHGNLNQFVYAFTLGAFFGFIYLKTGKIIYTITLHMGINFMGSVVSVLLTNMSIYEILPEISGNAAAVMRLFSEHPGELVFILLYFAAFLGFMISGIILLILNARKLFSVSEETHLSKKTLSAAFLNLGVILYTLFWIVQIMLQLLE